MYVFLTFLIVTTEPEFLSNHGCVFKANLDSTKYVRDSNKSIFQNEWFDNGAIQNDFLYCSKYHVPIEM